MMQQNQANEVKLTLRQYIEELFGGYATEPKIEEIKEEVYGNMNDKITDYMQQGLSFEEAFHRAKMELGDVTEMIDVEKERQNAKIPMAKPILDNEDKNRMGMLTSLSALLYVLVGMTFGAWHWFWMIIPVTSILCSNAKPPAKLVALTPFIYIFLGFFFGLWATAWIIMPASAIVLGFSKK